MAGHLGLRGNAEYTASKHAMIGLTETMALEYKPLGVRIYSRHPGAYGGNPVGVMGRAGNGAPAGTRGAC